MVKVGRPKFSFSNSSFWFLFRLWLKIQLSIINKCVLVVQYQVLDLVRADFEDKYESIHSRFTIVATKILLSMEQASEEREFHQDNVHIVNSIVEKCSCDDEIVENVARYRRLRKTYWSGIDIPDDIPHKGDIESDEIKVLTSKEVGDMHTFFARALKKARRKNKNHLKSLKRFERFEAAPKIDIEASMIYQYLSLVSVLFLCSGFLYTHFLMEPLLENYANYYNLSDYLSSSLDVVVYAIAVSIISFILGNIMFPSGDQEDTSTRSGRVLKTVNDIIWYMIPISGVFWVGVALKMQDEFLFYKGLVFLGMLVGAFFSGRIAVYYFKEYQKAFVIMMCVTFLVFSLCNKSIKQREAILSNAKGVQFAITTTSNEELTSDRCAYVTANERFVFLYDTDNKKTIIVPLLNIKDIKIDDDDSSIFTMASGLFGFFESEIRSVFSKTTNPSKNKVWEGFPNG